MADNKIIALLAVGLLLMQNASAAGTKLIESSAFVKDNELEVKMLFRNTEDRDSEVKISVNYFGQLETVVETIPANTTKQFNYRIKSISPGEVRFALIGDTNSFIKIIIPEDYISRNVLLVHEISSEEWRNNLPGEGILNKLAIAFNHLLTSPDVIAVATVLLAAVAILLAIKIFFRRKSDREKTVEINEKLLGEIGEIEKKRKRVQDRFGS